MISPAPPVAVAAKQIEICEECNAEFVQRIELVKHYRIKHGYTMAEAVSKAAQSITGPPGV